MYENWATAESRVSVERIHEDPLSNQQVLQQQYVDHKIANVLLKKGTREAYKKWNLQDRAWVATTAIPFTGLFIDCICKFMV